ncbi:Got1-domain-containing protein [Aureobasidium sp. EXF-8846]|nr:Got1-domain-containing protein [Aureobasidium sp. EXF-8846]
MPTMWLSDSQKIGVAFCSGGRLAMGNILFLAGITLLLGVQRTFLFFARRQKIKGTAAFVAGIILILLRWPLIGFLVEIYGIFILFGEFFKTIAGFAYNIPVIGPYLARGLQKAGEKAGEGNRNKDLPV